MAGNKSGRKNNTKNNHSNRTSTSDEEDCAGNSGGIKGMFTDILNEIKEIRRQNEDFREETKKNITDLKNEIKNFDKKLEEKCCSLEEKIISGENSTNDSVRRIEERLKTLENAEEKRQRSEKRNNIIIKSKDFDEETNNTKDDKVKAILRKIECKEDYTRATFIGRDKLDRGLVKVQMKTMEDKIAVMKNKSKLKGQDCYIDSDLTRQEREIQQTLRQRAREEREKGNTVQVGYQKMLINNQWVNWTTLLQQQDT